MSKRRIHAIALTSLVALGAVTTPAPSVRASDAKALEPGARIRATVVETTSDGKTRSRDIDGTFVAMDDSTLTIQPHGAKKSAESSGAANLMIPRETVYDLETRVRPGRKTKGALIGFLVGGAFGAVLGYSDGDDPPGIMSFSAGAKAGMGAMVFAPLGAVIGALAAPGEQWAPVSTRDVTVGFGQMPGGPTGLVVALRF